MRLSDNLKGEEFSDVAPAISTSPPAPNSLNIRRTCPSSKNNSPEGNAIRSLSRNLRIILFSCCDESAYSRIDERNWRLVLRPNIKFQNGKPLTAVAMASAMNRQLESSALEVTLLVYPQQPDWAKLATAMQAQLREVGFRLRIHQVEDINAAMKSQTGWHAAINSPGLVTTGGAPDPFLREHLYSR
ncbi:MAG: hypothetical protein ABIU20_02310, partial [Blastocatellia bacterium]